MVPLSWCAWFGLADGNGGHAHQSGSAHDGRPSSTHVSQSPNTDGKIDLPDRTRGWKERQRDGANAAPLRPTRRRQPIPGGTVRFGDPLTAERRMPAVVDRTHV